MHVGAPPATLRIQPVWLNGTTHQRNRRERPVCRSGNAPNITRAGEWYYAIYGTPNVAAMIHRHDTVTNTTRADEWYYASRGGY